METPFIRVSKENTNILDLPLCVLDLTPQQKKEITLRDRGVVFK
jgi:hypothetical protein